MLQPEFEDSPVLTTTDAEEELGMDFTEDIQFMTHPEFNRFLLDLFGKEKEKEIPSVSTPQSRTRIKSAVDFLIRAKLKTVVGRAQDFFGQLQLVFRKARRSNYQLPLWKLEFAYELEKKILLCIYQSTFLPCNVPEVSSRRNFSFSLVTRLMEGIEWNYSVLLFSRFVYFM